MSAKIQKALDYFRNNHVGVLAKHKGFLEFLFPGIPVYTELPMWDKDDLYILLGSADRVPGNCVRINPLSPKRITNRKVFLEFMEAIGLSLSGRLDYINNLEDEEFWYILKQIYVLEKATFIPKDVDTGMTGFDLFKVLFDKFENSYTTARCIETHYKVLVSVLVTMMLKAKNIEFTYTGDLSKGYLKALRTNAKHLELFQNALLTYFKTEMTYFDFLLLLFNCSRRYA